MSTKIPGFTGAASLCQRGSYKLADIRTNATGKHAVAPQLDNDIYTTRDVCKACGCTASDVACDCGGSKSKLDCVTNGGPSKALPVFSGSIGAGIFRAQGAFGTFANKA